MITVGSDHSGIHGIFKYGSISTIGSEIYSWLRNNKCVVHTSNASDLLKSIKDSNSDMYDMIETFISKGSINESNFSYGTRPSGIPYKICDKLDKIDIKSTEFSVSGEAMEHLDKWIAHTRARLHSVNHRVNNLPHFFSSETKHLKKDEILTWKQVFSGFRHSTENILIQDQYLKDEDEVVEFIAGLTTSNLSLKKVSIITKEQVASYPPKSIRFDLLLEKLRSRFNPKVDLIIYRFSEELASELIHYRCVLSDALLIKLDRGVNIFTKKRACRFNGPIQFSGKYFNAGSDYHTFNLSIIELLKHPEIITEC